MKYVVDDSGVLGDLSLPVRGAWIEIAFSVAQCRPVAVAPRKGSVD